MGSTITSFRKRFNSHKRSLNRFSKEQRGNTGEHSYTHFCEPEHKGLEDMQIKIIHKADRSNPTEREGFVCKNQSLVHTIDPTTCIRTRSIRKQSMIHPQGLANIKQKFFFVSSFVRFMASLCLDYDLMLTLTAILMSQARLHSFVCLVFLTLCLRICSSVNQALACFTREHKYMFRREVFIS